MTPLTSLLVEEGFRAAGGPDDVFLVATGGGATGAALVDEADMIMFTGSTKTGKKVMARAAETLTPVSLELGGKDPMIVLRDADLERAANAAVYNGYANGGQICISVERVYVEEPVYEEFVLEGDREDLALRQGQPGGYGTIDVGAITFPPQADIIERHVDGRRRQGRARADGRQARRRARTVLRADRAHGRRPHDGDHDRGDVRPDAADHEGARRRGGAAARERHALRAELERVDEGHREAARRWPTA